MVNIISDHLFSIKKPIIKARSLVRVSRKKKIPYQYNKLISELSYKKLFKLVILFKQIFFYLIFLDK